jgi:hypothetical protein
VVPLTSLSLLQVRHRDDKTYIAFVMTITPAVKAMIADTSPGPLETGRERFLDAL